MHKRRIFPVLTIIFLLLQNFSPLIGYFPVLAGGNEQGHGNDNGHKSQSCPTGDGWTEPQNPKKGKNYIGYEAPNGEKVVEVCVKGKKQKVFISNFIKNKDSNEDGCHISVSGIGGNKSKVSVTNKYKLFGKNCSLISASFKLKKENYPTDTPKPQDTVFPTISDTPPTTVEPTSEPLVCKPEVNLLKNGSFEKPLVETTEKWDIFNKNNDELDWAVEWLGEDTSYNDNTRPEDANLELHRSVNGWLANDGDQYAELDSDWDGVQNTLQGEPASVKISQEIQTIPGYKYEVSYDFSPRPRTSVDNNKLKVEWNTTELSNESKDGTDNANTVWENKSLEVIADSEITIVSFSDQGIPNSEGTFLDNVSVRCLGESGTVKGDEDPNPSVTPSQTITPSSSPTATPIPSTTPPMCKEGPTWVSRVNLEATTQGTNKDGSAVSFDRTNPDNALSSPDGKFFSLGKDGVLFVEFEYPILNVAGNDLSIHEITNSRETYPEEKAKVEVSLDGSTFYYLGEASNKSDSTGDLSGRGGKGVSLFDLDTVGLPAIKYVRLTDITDFSLHIATADGFDVDAIDASYGICEDSGFTSTVQLCKYDDKQNPLPGWNVQLLGDKVNSVEVKPDDLIGGSITPAYSTELPWGDYVLVASGSYKYRGGTNLLADPAYSQRLETDQPNPGDHPYFPWVNNMHRTVQGSLGVIVNDVAFDWGYFSPSHEYAKGYPGYSGVFSFTSLDDYTKDNVGSMNVDIYKGYAGITSEKGCVEFTNVPYGTYTVEETLKQNWENVTGKGQTLEVNKEFVSGGLVNKDNTPKVPAKLYTSKVVCTDEKYLPNQSISITENSAEEWVIQSEGKCSLVEDWGFQYGPEGAGSFGEFQTDTNILGEPWTTIGVGETEIPVEHIGKRIEVREFFPNSDYVPFSNNSDESAVLWCSGDSQGFDNWEWVNIKEGGQYYCTAFNALKTGTIHGFKYIDVNGDRELVDDPVYPLDEDGNGWLITLLGEGGLSREVRTNSEGYYEFLDLPLGTYKVCEEARDGWLQTVPGIIEENDGCYEVTLTGQDVEVSKDFGNFELGRVSGYKFEDYNGNGERDEDEKGLKNWQIELWKGEEKIKTEKTNKNGKYEFSNLEAGEYKVCEVQKDDWTSTLPTGDEPCYTFTVVSGFNKLFDFGNFKLGNILGFKFEDKNGNGRWDFGEFGKGHWNIQLFNEDWEELANTQTLPVIGIYYLDGLKKGTYYVCEEARDGWLQTFPTESEITREGQNCYQVVISHSDQLAKPFNFGNMQYGEISGVKFEDVNGNGAWDREAETERVLVDGEWTIVLKKNGEEIDRTHTVEGVYSFKVKPGEYEVCEEETNLDWKQTAPNNDTGCHTIKVKAGQKFTDVNFGNFKLGQILGYKWDDDNGNGEKDYGEPKLEGWTIELHKTMPTDAVELAPYKTAVTDKNGEYSFTGLEQGTYYVQEITQAPWKQTFPNDPMYHVVTIEVSGQVIDDVNFGNNLTADLMVTKTPKTTDPAVPGELFTYEITVKNVGTEDISVEGVNVWDDLPAEAIYHSSNPAGSYDNLTHRITWVIPSLDVADEWTAEITVLIPENISTEITEITNRVEAMRTCLKNREEVYQLMADIPEPVIEFCEEDPTPDNNVDTSTVEVNHGNVLGEGTIVNPTPENKRNELSSQNLLSGSVLGASTNLLQATGRSLLIPVLIGSTLLGALLLINKPIFRKLKR